METRYILQFEFNRKEWLDVSLAPLVPGVNHLGYLGAPEGYEQLTSALEDLGGVREICSRNGLGNLRWRVVRRDFTDVPI